MRYDIAQAQGGKMMEIGEYQHVEGSIMLAGLLRINQTN
jgi:hypothetical protein